jgi:hypothetical protein
MSHTVNSHGRITHRVRRIAGPLVLASALGASAFGATPAALASPMHGVRSHTRCADVALHSVMSAATSGKASIGLGTFTSQLDAAAKISAKLALHADTATAAQVAADAINIVAREEVKAEAQLTAAAAMATSTEQSVLAHAAVTVADTREVTLGAMAKLAAQAKVHAQAGAQVLAKQLATLTAQGKAVLVNLAGVVAKLNGSVSAGASANASVMAQLATTETADLTIDVKRVEDLVALIGGKVRADVAALSDMTAELAGQIESKVGADCSCNSTGSGSLQVSLSGQALASATASALAAVPGATIDSAATLLANLTGAATFEVDITTASGTTETVTEDSSYGVLNVQASGSGSARFTGSVNS